MSEILLASGLIVSLLATLLLVNVRHVVVNPATYIFLVFAYSVFAKVAYIGLVYEPEYDPTDRIFILNRDPSFLWIGVRMSAVSAVAYAIGFLALGKKIPALAVGTVPTGADVPVSGVFLVGIGCLASFILFAVIGGHELVGGALSEKRFLMHRTGASTRFELIDYYFFKASLLALPLTALACFVWSRIGKGLWAATFAILLAFSFWITLFASVRLFFIILALQLILILWTSKMRARYWLVALILGVTLLQAGTATLLRHPGSLDSIELSEQSSRTEKERPSRENDDQPWLVQKAEKAIHLVFRGRYFLDISKLALIGQHFPEKQEFLYGGSFRGVPVKMPASLAEILPEHPDLPNWQAPWGGADVAPGSTVYMRINNYLGTYVFREPANGMTIFAGQIYIDFGYLGLAIGFFLVGLLHRLMFNIITHGDAKWWVRLITIMALPMVTLLLLNSGLVSAVARVVTDALIIPAVLLGGWIWRQTASFSKVNPRSS